SRPPKTSKPHAPSLLFLLVHRAGRSCKNTVLPCHKKAQKAQKQFIKESALSDLLFCVFCAFLWLNKSLEPQIVSVGCDGDRAGVAGSEDRGAVCLPAIDNVFVWVTKHRIAPNGDDREGGLCRVHEDRS